MATITNNQAKLDHEAEVLKKQMQEQEKTLASVNAKLKNKKNSKKTKAKLKSQKSKIIKLINKIKADQALLPKKFVSTQFVAGARGSAKTVKIPGDNLFAISRAGIPTESMEKLFFDSIGTTEIINIERHDNINTINAPYQPIVDIASINTEYNVNKIVSLQKIASLYFNTFGISFETYQPENGTGPANEIVYVEDATGDLIINVLDLPDNFRVEVQVMSFEDILNDTVYGII